MLMAISENWVQSWCQLCCHKLFISGGKVGTMATLGFPWWGYSNMVHTLLCLVVVWYWSHLPISFRKNHDWCMYTLNDIIIYECDWIHSGLSVLFCIKSSIWLWQPFTVMLHQAWYWYLLCCWTTSILSQLLMNVSASSKYKNGNFFLWMICVACHQCNG